MKKPTVKYLLLTFVCIGITFILHFVDKPFWFNENQMLYIFSTIAQVTGGLFGLTLAAYTIVDDKLKKIGDEEETSADYVTDIRNETFNSLIQISILSIFTIILCLMMLAIYRNRSLDITIFFMLESIAIFIMLLQKLYLFIKSASPQKIENKKAEEKDLIDSEYTTTNDTQERRFGSFITYYNLLESTIKNLAQKLLTKNNNKTQLQIFDALDILKDYNIISQKCYGIINDLRLYRNSLVHSTENDKNVNPSLYEILEKIYTLLAGIDEKYDSSNEKTDESLIIELDKYIKSLPDNIDFDILNFIRENPAASLYDVSGHFNISATTARRKIQKLISYGYLIQYGKGRQLKWKLAVPEIAGYFSFDYSNNNGIYNFGDNEYSFTTKWSKASDKYIHAYSDPNNIECIARIKNVPNFYNISENQLLSCDYSSRCRDAGIGDVIVWRNSNGHYLLTLILKIQDDTRNDDTDLVEGKYRILKTH